MAFKYQHLTKELRDKINHNWWAAGERLPSIRQLCQSYQASLATVRHALAELEAQGYLEARDRSGYFVRARQRRVPVTADLSPLPGQPQPTAVTLPDLLYDIMQRSAAFDFYPRGPLVQLPQLKTLQQLQTKVTKQLGAAPALQYEEPFGALELRQQLATSYQSHGLTLDAPDLYLTAGCQHALFLALHAICSPGDIVVVEQPGFYGVLQLLQQLQLQVIEVPTDHAGMDISALELVVARWRIKACIVSPSFGTPSGQLMPEERKQRLVELANSNDFALIEDDIYGDLGFYQRPTPLKALDTENRVVLCSSLSKSLSRDLRIGWIAPARWSQQIGRLKLTSQLAGSQGNAIAVARFIAEGHYRRHLQQFRTLLIHHHNQLHQALQQLFLQDPQVQQLGSIDWNSPHGGLSLWLKLPPAIDALQLYNRGLNQGLVLTPGALFTASDQFKNYLRVPFVNPVAGPRLDALQQLKQLILAV
ncbi:PLP-dependent aminotransferase family protein [Rheinheimera marina]|uniref:PLP-dependent aminotransferase family protein n=1 Tax=Rheinheimera marina TaxID=1774958 RepID=A0ABV9JMT1_9GAMM